MSQIASSLLQVYLSILLTIAYRNVDHLTFHGISHRFVLVVHNDNSRLIGDNKQEAASI